MSALRRLTAKRPAYDNIFFRNADSTTLFGIGDDEVVTEDVELLHDLDAAPVPARLPTSPPEALLIAMEPPVDALNGTILSEHIDDVVNAEDADRREIACQLLTKTMMDSVCATIVLSEKSGGESYGFKISAGKGGVVLDADSIKFAVIFLGSPLPKQPVFKLIFKPGNRTLLNVPSREEGFLKRMVWPFNGAKGAIAQNPAKVCAITRKLYKNLSRDCLCKPLTHRCRTTSIRN